MANTLAVYCRQKLAARLLVGATLYLHDLHASLRQRPDEQPRAIGRVDADREPLPSVQVLEVLLNPLGAFLELYVVDVEVPAR